MKHQCLNCHRSIMIDEKWLELQTHFYPTNINYLALFDSCSGLCLKIYVYIYIYTDQKEYEKEKKENVIHEGGRGEMKLLVTRLVVNNERERCDTHTTPPTPPPPRARHVLCQYHKTSRPQARWVSHVNLQLFPSERELCVSPEGKPWGITCQWSAWCWSCT